MENKYLTDKRHEELIKSVEKMAGIIRKVNTFEIVDDLKTRYISNSLFILLRHFTSYHLLLTVNEYESARCLLRVIFELVVRTEYALRGEKNLKRMELRHFNYRKKAINFFKNSGEENWKNILKHKPSEYNKIVEENIANIERDGVKKEATMRGICTYLDKRENKKSFQFQNLYFTLYYFGSFCIHSDVHNILGRQSLTDTDETDNDIFVIVNLTAQLLEKIVERYEPKHSKETILNELGLIKMETNK